MRKFKHVWNKFYIKVNMVLSVLSYFMICALFGYIIYYLFIKFNATNVITGCISLYIMIHLNKSL